VQARMQASLQVGAGAGETQPVGYVTHVGPIAALLKALGMDEAVLESHRVYDHRNPLPPAGVWRLRRDESIHGWGMELVYPPRNH